MASPHVFMTYDDREFVKSFEVLAKRITDSALRSALLTSVKLVAKAYEANLKSHVGTTPPVKKLQDGSYGVRKRLSEIAAYKVWRFPDGSGYAGYVGPEAGEARHAHLVEDGTVKRIRVPGVLGPGGGFGYANGQRGGINGRYWFVEFLIQAGVADSKKRNTGVMPAFHPLAKASSANQEVAKQTFIEEYKRRVLAKGSSLD